MSIVFRLRFGFVFSIFLRSSFIKPCLLRYYLSSIILCFNTMFLSVTWTLGFKPKRNGCVPIFAYAMFMTNEYTSVHFICGPIVFKYLQLLQWTILVSFSSSLRTCINSVECLNGFDTSNIASFKMTQGFPVYQSLYQPNFLHY